MVRPGRERLTGRIQVGETYLEGIEEVVRGRQTFKKALIAVAAEENGKAVGRIRMLRIPDASAISLRWEHYRFVNEFSNLTKKRPIKAKKTLDIYFDHLYSTIK